MKVVATTCSGYFAGKTVLFEPPDFGLPAGLLSSCALVRVTQGIIYIPGINVSKIDIMLFWNSFWEQCTEYLLEACRVSSHKLNLFPPQ